MSAETSASPIAELRQVTKRRGETLALDNLDLQLPASGGSALVGQSGSGKSTVLELLIGLLQPDSGRVLVFGEPVEHATIRQLRRRIGYAIQETGLFPHLSVRDNIVLPARLAGLTEAEALERCDDLARMMNLAGDLMSRYPLQLSGGQQQRAGICRSMILRPRLLLLDEPFSGLDIVTRREIYDRFLRLAERDRTAYVLVTHDLNEAAALCDHLVVLHKGKIVQQGKGFDVLRRPASDYVRRMIAAQEGHGRAAF